MIGNEFEKYKLFTSGFDAGSSGLGDEFAYSNEMYFTTRDNDNDRRNQDNCANYYGGGGWWYDNCAYFQLNRADSYGPQWAGANDDSMMVLKRYYNFKI